MIAKRQIIFLILVLLFGEVHSQDIMKRPKRYNAPNRTDVQLNVNAIGELSESYQWIVYCSNPGNYNGNAISFMQEFYVSKIIEVGKIKVVDKITGSDYGIVPMSNFLLWDKGLIDKKSGFRLKLLLVNNIMELQNEDYDDARRRQTSLYKSPSVESDNFQVSAFNEYWFLYKETEHWYLIGRASSIEDDIADEESFGWVEKNKVQLWDKRLVLQPNQAPEAIKDRLDKKEKNPHISITSFLQKEEAVRYYDSASQETESLNLFSDALKTLFNEEKVNSQWIRWPVLTFDLDDKITIEKVYKVGVVGRPFDKGDKFKIEDNREIPLMDSIINNQQEYAKNIDVVFVIDGTKSMKASIDAVKNALNNSINTISNRLNSSYQFRFAAVVYTDTTEYNDCAKPEKFDCVVDQSGGLGSAIGVINFLKGKTEYHKSDQSPEEAVFLGLLEGLKKFKNEKHQNYIIHIGDAGANDKVKNRKKVLDQLRKYFASIICIQANNLPKNDGDDSFVKFQKQMVSLLNQHGLNSSRYLRENSSDEVYAGLGIIEGRRGSLTPDRTVSSSRYKAYKMDFLKYPIRGYLQILYDNKKLDSLDISSFINGSFENIRQLNMQMRGETSRSKNEGLEGLELKGGVLKNLIQAGLTKEQIDLWLRERFLSMIEVYVPITTKELEYDLLEYAIFVDKDEFKRLKDNLKTLVVSGGTYAQKRVKIYQAMKSLCETHIEPNSIDNTKISELMTLITGLPSKSDLLFKYRLGDILRPGVVPDSSLDGIINLVKDKVNKELKTGNLPKYRNRNQIYYWIPIRFLP